MGLKNPPSLDIGSDLIEAIRAFPVRREIEHCGARIAVDPFEFYATCPHCGSRIKVRSYAGAPEIEDIFDAVFEWMNQEGAREVTDHSAGYSRSRGVTNLATPFASRAPSPSELEILDRFYREGGLRAMASPHVHYDDPNCPHPGCTHQMEWIDFKLELHGDPEGIY